MADDTGRCVNCGFLGKLRRQVDAETIVYSATSYNRETGTFYRYSGWPDQRDIPTQPTCFRNAANLQKELVDALAMAGQQGRDDENEHTLALIEKPRKCESWYPWTEYLDPKEHFEEFKQSCYVKQERAAIIEGSPSTAFIAHEGETKALDKLKAFLDALGVKYLIAEIEPSNGRLVERQVDWTQGKANFAIILATKGKTVNKKTKKPQIGLNVADELGRARTVFKNRIILLLQQGVEPHTNIGGIVYERFTPQSMDKAFIKVARELINWDSIPFLKENRSIPISNSESKRDALEHFLIEDKQRRSLSVLNGLPEKPIVYPLVLRNTRPIPIDIVGYEITILWDNRAFDTISWQHPSAFATSGIRVKPPFKDTSSVQAIQIDGDIQRDLAIYVNLQKIKHWPIISPMWAAKGHLKLECCGESMTKTFDLSTDCYQLTQKEWDKLRAEIDPQS